MERDIDEWFQHEGLDRAHILLCQLEAAFGSAEASWEATYEAQTAHPSIYNQRTNDCLKRATEALAELYQAIGEWDEQ